MQLTVQSDTVPSPLNCVVTDANWKLLVALLSVTVPDSATQINFGSQTPIPSRRKYPWVRTNTDTTPATPVWVYSGGFWLLPHYTYNPVNDLVDSDRVILWLGNPLNIDTFDGGETGTITDISGPMWSIFSSMAAKVPIAPGALPSGKVLAVGNTGGEENHLLTIAEQTPHTHKLGTLGKGNADGNDTGLDEGVVFSSIGAAGPITNLTESALGNGSGTDAHNTMPPYYCINFLRKTPRKFYRISP